MDEMNRIIEIVSEQTGLDITKRTRKREYVDARSIYYKLAYDDLRLGNLTDIGLSLGRDHATVLHSIKGFKSNIEVYNKKMYLMYLTLKGMLTQDSEVNSYLFLRDEFILLKDKYEKLYESYNNLLKKDSYIDNTYKSLSDENKQKFKVRVEAILKMMTA